MTKRNRLQGKVKKVEVLIHCHSAENASCAERQFKCASVHFTTLSQAERKDMNRIKCRSHHT